MIYWLLFFLYFFICLKLHSLSPQFHFTRNVVSVLNWKHWKRKFIVFIFWLFPVFIFTENVFRNPTKFAHFIPINIIFSLEKLTSLYINEIVKLHGVPSSIVFDRDLRFTSRFRKNQNVWSMNFKCERFGSCFYARGRY